MSFKFLILIETGAGTQCGCCNGNKEDRA